MTSLCAAKNPVQLPVRGQTRVTGAHSEIHENVNVWMRNGVLQFYLWYSWAARVRSEGSDQYDGQEGEE